MERHQNIYQLLKKLEINSLDKQELNQLIHLLKNQEEVFEDYLTTVWNEENISEIECSDDQGLNKIHMEIDSLPNERVMRSLTNNRKINTLNVIFKYAALFILILGIGWIWQYYSNRSYNHNINSSRINEVAVSYGSKSRIVLPDGTIVNLNSGSRIKYASNFELDRKVYLEGEAFFNVKKDPDHPFLVHTSDITVRVLGTVFNVKSYPEENIIETTLLSGSVQIFGKDMDDQHPGKEITLLKPNEKAVFFKNGTIELKKEEFSKGLERVIPAKGIKIESQVKTDIITAWKNNQLVFNNEKFETLIPKLERWFNVEIDNKDVDLNNNRLTGKFDLETLEQAMEALRITTPFRYKIEKNRLTILK